MHRDDLVRLIIWTMKNYGSDATELVRPGSKLKSQAEHIADVIEQYDEACNRVKDLEHIRVTIAHHKL